MKVGLLCVGWPGRDEVGGAARYAWRFAETIRDHVDLHVITSSGGQPLDGVTMHYIPNGGGRFDHYYRFPFRVRSILPALDLDVLHAFGDDWAVGTPRPAWVRTFHGSSMSEARSSTGLRRYNHYLLSAFEHLVRKRCDLAIAVGPESLREFRADLLLPPVVPIDSRRHRVEPTDSPSVVFVGGYSGRKRGEFALRAIEQAEELTGRSIQLHAIGPKSDSRHWASRVELHSELDDEAVLDLISSSWVLIAPSSYEGFGIPAFEALSLGVAALSSPNPGSVYIGDRVADAAAFGVVNDDEFSRALAARINAGPIRGSRTAHRGQEIARDIAGHATAEEIVELYKTVVRERTVT